MKFTKIICIGFSPKLSPILAEGFAAFKAKGIFFENYPDCATFLKAERCAQNISEPRLVLLSDAYFLDASSAVMADAEADLRTLAAFTRREKSVLKCIFLTQHIRHYFCWKLISKDEPRFGCEYLLDPSLLRVALMKEFHATPTPKALFGLETQSLVH